MLKQENMRKNFKDNPALGEVGAMNRRDEELPRIGVFGVGYAKYWPQFEGLLEALLEKQRVFIAKLQRNQVEIVDFGMVDDATSAYELVPKLQAANLDLIFCDMLTYATS